jgi:hypothetical protein
MITSMGIYIEKEEPVQNTENAGSEKKSRFAYDKSAYFTSVRQKSSSSVQMEEPFQLSLKAHMALCLFQIPGPFAGRAASAAVAAAGIQAVFSQISDTDIYHGNDCRQGDQCSCIHRIPSSSAFILTVQPPKSISLH